MSELRALGIDVGSTTTKASLIAVEDGRVRELGTSTGPTAAGADDLIAQVMDRCRTVLDHAGAGNPESPPLAAVGVASMAETGVPIDQDGTALTELLRWDAGYGATEAAGLAETAGELFTATGVRLAAKTPLATWGWLRRDRPDVWERMACWLGVADLVVHALTGARVTDHTLAGRTGGYRLPGADGALPGTFDAGLLELVGLTPDRLPVVARPDAAAGTVSATAADRWQVAAAGVPVVVAGHDHQVAAWAAGVRAPGQVADSLGTAEAVLGVLADRPDMAAVRAEGMSLVRVAAGDCDALISGTPTAGAMLRSWLADVSADRRDEVLAEAARDGDLAPTGAAVLPYLRGRQTPRPDPAARAGVPPSGWPLPRQARAVLEGICYQARWMMDGQSAMGQAPSRVAVIGGDRLPRLWLDLKQATLPWPVALIGAAEPVAAGAALLALVRAGALGPVDEMLHRGPTLDHTLHVPDGADPHGPAYARFVMAATAGGYSVPPNQPGDRYLRGW